jgi:hypothetical protein
VAGATAAPPVAASAQKALDEGQADQRWGQGAINLHHRARAAAGQVDRVGCQRAVAMARWARAGLVAAPAAAKATLSADDAEAADYSLDGAPAQGSLVGPTEPFVANSLEVLVADSSAGAPDTAA